MDHEGYLKGLLKKGFILYPKNDIIGTAEIPRFGEVTIKYKNGQPYQVLTTISRNL
ncbi:hypothetical protein [Streptococcus merionis]|uniref:Uncharacterized protein n=1 Tax=Streptococcus merionis TaxID=400065 RepID=A0A239T0Y2_9STRE|nr:hypothetical protein [Streptococcus merionis]QBX08764.1 hypothetical protein JavanS294_0005 [Streptococcus satellite phage Javan294]SNU90614.1 Uncharacterised protein [Streptococcus merionis]